ncbi:heterogeneous nuclear ribonucleoprotein F isoform X2 [Myotis lucifugus]|uniref:heterogeneous nuclear ribonucleoprotein F isoform X2 n=1 Tax=Myotis lucifugus TaxID=59463 RepID=UPI0006D70F94|nr:heterogeneous nuclear ribonucleoprotein F isoform X2 [Myotis lucifugus]XP_023620482.1 heterogeneous nuclear ribonucleoprotein F isoform X2 [Myotis lucifugus]
MATWWSGFPDARRGGPAPLLSASFRFRRGSRTASRPPGKGAQGDDRGAVCEVERERGRLGARGLRFRCRRPAFFLFVRRACPERLPALVSCPRVSVSGERRPGDAPAVRPEPPVFLRRRRRVLWPQPRSLDENRPRPCSPQRTIRASQECLRLLASLLVL